MIKLQAFGTIKDGKLTITNRKRFNQDLSSFKDCQVELTIKKKGRRSNSQNAYYWAVVVKEIEVRMRELGNDVDTDLVHAFLKDKFNKKELVGEGGEVLDYFGGSTTELTKFEFSEYIENIAQWASEYLGIMIPMPNTDLVLNF